METAIYESFEQNFDDLHLLLNTGNATITHKQDRTRWRTLFPEILMKVRQQLRDEMQVPTSAESQLPGINILVLSKQSDAEKEVNSLALFSHNPVKQQQAKESIEDGIVIINPTATELSKHIAEVGPILYIIDPDLSPEAKVTAESVLTQALKNCK